MAFLIVDITEADLWPEHQVPGAKPRRIPADCRPTVLQVEREAAEAELLRLAKRYPRREFVLFEPRLKGLTVKVPTHVTLAGKVAAERSETLLVKVATGDAAVDDELPF
ncbi:hypothetical protein CKO44_16065 [Rubrivivax gelatinosus]|uniref:hypothetical protein n=1 Tax=Rubrivivax gelatinosus TaxID=28068 RepID=UPI0019072173|nr:hypothetical protein [Rubrivivax gelatinosus]MBK1614985.1 hypothetical protein [Rubrivivax gelatinosus]MBZ8143151.1 hypothetical protein [Rubrivivax gelatinosus]